MSTSTASSPAVSVIIPAYNVAPFIGETLDALFAQTFRDFEALVVDDGSVDGLEQALAPYRNRIRYLRRANGGLSAARNTGIEHARGRYIALLDGDDVWMPRYLEALVSRLEADPGLALMYPNAIYFGDSDLAGRLHQDVYPSRDPVTFDRLIANQCHVFGSVVFRRDAIDAVGGFDETLRGGVEDFDMWLRMTQAGARLSFTAEMLVRYRRRADAMSKDPSAMLRNQVRVLDKAIERGVTESQRAVLDERRRHAVAQLDVVSAKQLIRRGDTAGALERIRSANAYFRNRKLAWVARSLETIPSVAVRAFKMIEAMTARA